IERSRFWRRRKFRLVRKKDTEASLAIAIENAITMDDSGVLRCDNYFVLYKDKKYSRANDKDFEIIFKTVLQEMGVGKVYIVNSPKVIFNHITRSAKFKEYKPTRSLIAFKNIVLNLDTMDTYDHSPKYHTGIYLNIDYDKNAKCKRWDKFLTEVLSTQDLIDVLQEFLGFIFIDRSKWNIEVMIYLLGNGSNGKGVVEHVIRKILGQENVCPYSLYDLCESSTADYKCAVADGKLLNFCPDMGDKDFSGGRYKAIISGEPIPARPINKEPYTAVNMPVFAASLNSMPATSDNSNGYYRRNKIIPFDRVFKDNEQDKGLKKKLESELSGIFNWIMIGRERLIKNEGNFTDSQRIKEMNEENKRLNDSLVAFLYDNDYFPNQEPLWKGRWITIQSIELYNRYKTYCMDNGRREKSSTKIGKELNILGYGDNKRKSMGVFVYSIFIRDSIETKIIIKEQIENEELPF
ncbi:MAG: phage/plasmid primase, P4 family, partial [Muribaculaceae bacterium]